MQHQLKAAQPIRIVLTRVSSAPQYVPGPDEDVLAAYDALIERHLQTALHPATRLRRLTVHVDLHDGRAVLSRRTVAAVGHMTQLQARADVAVTKRRDCLGPTLQPRSVTALNCRTLRS
jgi:hypothetical protein